MDLLQYGSSSDEDDDNAGEQETKGPLKTRTPTSTATTASTTIAAAVATRTNNKSPGTAAAVLSKRGKKVLSLQAVLPQHILEQLTKSQVRAAGKSKRGDDDSDDDSDSDDNGEQKTNDDKKPAAAAAPAKKAPHVQEDAGISSFLSELSAARPTSAAPLLSKNQLPLMTSTGNSSTSSKVEKSKKSSERMGAAFLSATATVVSTSGSSSAAIRDIHGESNNGVVDNNRKPPPPPPEPADDDIQPGSFQQTAENNVGLCRPVVMAAPRVRAAPAVATMKAAPPPQEQQPTAPLRELSATSSSEPKQSKRSRREMERLLRHGQLDDAMMNNGDEGGVRMMSMEQVAPDQYQQAAPVEDTTTMQNQQQHGVKVVPTPMYDPSVGQTVKGIHNTSGSKGKNQITHLMQSAASLELSRARAVNSSTQVAKTNRANAKRKYGW